MLANTFDASSLKSGQLCTASNQSIHQVLAGSKCWPSGESKSDENDFGSLKLGAVNVLRSLHRRKGGGMCSARARDVVIAGARRQP